MRMMEEFEEPMDALEMLRADHDRVLEMFEHFADAKDTIDDDDKDALVARICGELIVHTAIEEELFYPEGRAAAGDARTGDLLDVATVEHASAKDLIAQLGEMEPHDALYDAKVIVLGEYVRHHIREEQNEIFARLRDAGLDLDDLGRRMAQRRTELMEEIGLADLDELLPQGLLRAGRGEVRTG
jgi:hypothetical protein